MEGATVVPRIAVSEAVAVQVYRLFCDKDAPAQLKPKGMRGVFAVLASLAHGRPVPADPAATDRLRAVLARKQSGKAPGLDPDPKRQSSAAPRRAAPTTCSYTYSSRTSSETMRQPSTSQHASKYGTRTVSGVPCGF